MLFGGVHIAKSPFEVDVGRAQGDVSKVSAQGPGLEPAGNVANKSTYFDVYTAGKVTLSRLVSVFLALAYVKLPKAYIIV